MTLAMKSMARREEDLQRAREILRILTAEIGAALTGASSDSRQTLPGDLFMAFSNHAGDGRKYIADALAKGAAAVCWEDKDGFVWDRAHGCPNRAMPDLRALAGLLAHELHGRPSERLKLIAVTGTNGKTTISQWLASAWPERCGVIGSLGAGFPEDLRGTGFTTPEAATLARLLDGILARGGKACALEASSIGIEEGRLNGATVDTAIFTNFTRDHFDYHGSMAAYAQAKEKLFHWPGLRLAVINLDGEEGRRLARVTTARRVIGYGLLGDLDADAPRAGTGGMERVVARHLRVTANRQAFTLSTPWGDAQIETEVLGAYNIANLLAVAATLLEAGLSMRETASRLERLSPPPGRMQRCGGASGDASAALPLVLVDYAHTPDALENALAALRLLAETRGGQLVCVFGCGGDRDRGKRPLMGEVAAAGADKLWITSDNPRHENPYVIIDDILQGVPANAPMEVEVDRGKAIRCAILSAAQPDVILLAGKGHEDYQEIGGKRYPFHDGEIARSALTTWRQTQQYREGWTS
ncbi:MAG: UDP-N-acetylmuramoyl-L-alanyl-D-glutamate--2,6-diaminopimelate ligase [Zoogloeaceae bacterium]|jgi:UDP-N-acetylmuramyl-tripeptide synthetase|nr:UDP-N-acetylmuramoyl-L-alanyl-D-glutamate--2,6-diaminopimelate ligase [Zoogloeaceae bacterium]